jgi:nucleotide-binding universal stress UspA family protein
MKRILIGVDGSKGAKHAAAYVGRIAAGNADLAVDVIRVKDPFPAGVPIPDDASGFKRAFERWTEGQESAGRSLLLQARTILVEAGVAEGRIADRAIDPVRSVARALIVAARESGCGTLVVGRRGVSMWNELAFGGTTEEILRYPIGITVWVVEEEDRTSDAASGRVLVGVDGSENGLRAARYAAEMLAPAGAFTITLAHVAEGGDQEAWNEQVLEEARAAAIEAGFPAERLTTRTLTPKHRVPAALLAEAGPGEYGTIVVGRRGRSAAAELVFGGVTERLLRYPTGRTIWVVA